MMLKTKNNNVNIIYNMIDPTIATLISSIGVLVLIGFSIYKAITKKNISKEEINNDISLLQMMIQKFTPRTASRKATEMTSVVNEIATASSVPIV